MTALQAVPAGLADELAELAARLYRFLISCEPSARPRRQPVAAVAMPIEPASSLAAHFAALSARASQRLGQTVEDIATQLHALGAALEANESYRELRSAWNRLGRSYEALTAQLRSHRATAVTELAQLKPANPYRNLFHAGMGVTGVLLYELAFDRPVMIGIGGTILAFFVFLEVLRRISPHWNERLVQRIFGRISRPSEAHHIPSATWYMAGLVIGVWLMPQHAIELGTLVLALADPTASLVGKRWGRLKIRGSRSAAGTAAFFGAALLTGLVFLSLVRPDLLWTMRLAVAAAVAGVGAITELFSGRRLDDNLTLPLCCGTVAALLL